MATAKGTAAIHAALPVISRASRSSLSWSSPGLRSSWGRPAATLVASSSLVSCPPPHCRVRGTCHPPSFSLPLEARDIHVRSLVEAFDPSVPLPMASTPPSSWYTDPYFMDVELERVFFRGWQAVGYMEQVQNPRDFFTGRLGTVQFVVCCDADGNLHAFHNICHHRATLLAYGSGRKSCFVCPYHVFERVTVQKCLSAARREDELDRLGTEALYAFVYPNFMDDDTFIQKSLEESEKIQMEDMSLCEAVQKGLESPAYISGRYSPSLELADHFHCLLYQSLNAL